MKTRITLSILTLVLACSSAFAAAAPDISMTAAASSIQSPDVAAKYAIDGDMSTRWGSKFTDNEWLEIAFDKTVDIYGVEIAWERAFAKSYTIEVSTDRKRWVKVYSTRAGRVGIRDIHFPKIRARYIRINTQKRGSGWGNSIYEVFVKFQKDQPPILDARWELVWADKFDSFDSRRWGKCAHTFAGNAAEFVPSNVRFTNGVMQLWLTKRKTVSREYAGGEIATRKPFLFGKFVVRMKPARGNGIVSSFFTYENPPAPWNEIDIEILGKDPGSIQFTHWTQPGQFHAKTVALGFDAAEDFHEYCFEWLPGSIQWFVDGAPMYTTVTDIPDRAQSIMMNLWISQNAEWAGAFDEKVLPARAEYDSVKYYKLKDGAKSSERDDAIRVVRDGKRYWFAQGDKKFFSRGVNCVLSHDGSKGKKYDARKKYGNNAKRWAEAAWKRLEGLGFTTVSGWSADAIYAVGMPHTRVAWLGSVGSNSLIDVFTDGYANDLFEDARSQIMPRQGEPGLIGWFANNEMPWYGEYGWPTDASRTLFDRYLKLPADAPGKQRLMAFLKEAYTNSAQAFSADWVEPINSLDDLKSITTLTPKNLRAKKLKHDWAGVIAERYFPLAKAAIEKYDPGSLFLGVRFAGCAPRVVLEVCGRYVDVMSLNYYRKDGVVDTVYLDNVYALTKKPIIITEFSFRAMENASGDSNTVGADVTVQTQADRADGYRRYCTTMASLPYIIGWDWFQYFDQAPGGRFDGENSNYGFVSIDDNVYPELADAMRNVNTNVDKLHAKSFQLLPDDFNEEAWFELRPIRVPKGAEGKEFSTLSWLSFPTESKNLNLWRDDKGGANIGTSFSNNTLVINFDTGHGWGCGMDMCSDLSPLKSDRSADVLGAGAVVFQAHVSAGTKFVVMINESGGAPVGEQYYVGKDGADGESFGSFNAVGAGEMKEYIFPLATFEPRTAYGNQRGNRTMDLQSIKNIALYFPARQGKGEMVVRKIEFTP